jgi:hypothetical protein
MPFTRKTIHPQNRRVTSVALALHPEIRGPTGREGARGLRGESGPQGVSGGGGGGATVEIVSVEPVAKYSPVCSDGRVADSNDLSSLGRVAGVSADEAAGPGFPFKVQVVGEISNEAWSWSAGDIVYLNGTGLSTSAPASGFIQRIGAAKNSSTIVINLSDPVLL